MVPPPGDALGRTEVDMARSVAGDADLRNGHMALDWRRIASIAAPIRDGVGVISGVNRQLQGCMVMEVREENEMEGIEGIKFT